MYTASEDAMKHFGYNKSTALALTQCFVLLGLGLIQCLYD